MKTLNQKLCIGFRVRPLTSEQKAKLEKMKEEEATRQAARRLCDGLLQSAGEVHMEYPNLFRDLTVN